MSTSSDKVVSTSSEGGTRMSADLVAMEEFSEFVFSNRPRVEDALATWLPLSTAAGTEGFNEALRYAVFPGGKRLRPFLTLLGADLGGVSYEQALLISCAVEFIHTSSLILDDLPSMDDAELRRNRPALHIVFGEGVAILAAVALLNQSYGLLAAAAYDAVQAARLPALIREAALCLGSSGMTAGQAADLALSGVHVERMGPSSRDLKTTALMRLMMVAGAIISGAPDAEVRSLADFGERLGKAYQIYDDLADTVGDRESTGKSSRQDLRHLRSTLVEGLSHAEVHSFAAEVLESAKVALAPFGDRSGVRLLCAAADNIFNGMRTAHTLAEKRCL